MSQSPFTCWWDSPALPEPHLCPCLTTVTGNGSSDSPLLFSLSQRVVIFLDYPHKPNFSSHTNSITIASVLITLHNKYYQVTLKCYSEFLQDFLLSLLQVKPQLPCLGKPIAGALCLGRDARLWPKAFAASCLHLKRVNVRSESSC